MKIALQGTDALWAFFGFFREHLAAFVSLLILVALALFLNWRLALLIVLCVLFRRAHGAGVTQDRDAAKHGTDSSLGSR
jgi:hypothetical protein